MKKLITLVVAIIMTVGMCLGLTACGEKPGEKKQIVVGITDSQPMNYRDANNEWTGFDTELTLKVFDALGYKVMFKEIVWPNKYTELQSGSIDCIWNGFTVNTTESSQGGVQRSELFNFTYSYMINEQCIVRNINKPDIKDVKEFNGVTVGVEEGSAGDSYISDIISTYSGKDSEEKIEGWKSNKKSVLVQIDALKEVNTGTCDYAIVDKVVAESKVGKGDFTNMTINEGVVIDVEYYGIGFAKNEKGEELKKLVNQQLDILGKSGYLLELATKYKLENRVITDFSKQK